MAVPSADAGLALAPAGSRPAQWFSHLPPPCHLSGWLPAQCGDVAGSARGRRQNRNPDPSMVEAGTAALASAARDPSTLFLSLGTGVGGVQGRRKGMLGKTGAWATSPSWDGRGSLGVPEPGPSLLLTPRHRCHPRPRPGERGRLARPLHCQPTAPRPCWPHVRLTLILHVCVCCV